MHTLKELYEHDFEKLLSITREVSVRDESTQEMLTIPERVHFDFERAAALVSYLVPYSNSTLSCCAALLSRPEDAVEAATSSVDIVQKSVFAPDGIAASALQFSREVIFYTENQMDDDEATALFELAKELAYTVYVRGPSYSEMRARMPRLIGKFMQDYNRSYDFFFSASRLAADLLENALIQRGIRAWVTFRAKRPDSLREKIERRALSLNSPKIFRTVDDIYADVPDLAGVRVALYFPQDRATVGEVIKQLFDVAHEKEMQGSSGLENHLKYSGYKATHYRASVKRDELSPSDQRFADARIEIQVASIIMNAWSEVEHDLVYKPKDGSLSPEERAILDELNGAVLAGERILERLQRASERRKEAIRDWRKTIAVKSERRQPG